MSETRQPTKEEMIEGIAKGFERHLVFLKNHDGYGYKQLLLIIQKGTASAIIELQKNKTTP